MVCINLLRPLFIHIYHIDVEDEPGANWKNILFYGGLIFGAIILIFMIIIIIICSLKQKKKVSNYRPSTRSIGSTGSYTSVISYE
jgi:ABC-type glycerol-3-phosphate transport system permease component